MTTQRRPMLRCACGNRMSRYSRECTACYKKKMDAAHAVAKAIVAKGACPTCGAGLRRNLSIAGWWQCDQYGAEQFRKDPKKPPCPFQIFTE